MQQSGLLDDTTPEIVRAATGFGGGIAGSRNICGIITGAVIAIGLKRGRTTPDGDRETSRDLAKELLEKFEERYGSLDCGKLVEPFEDFSSKERSEFCRMMTQQVGDEMESMLAEEK